MKCGMGILPMSIHGLEARATSLRHLMRDMTLAPVMLLILVPAPQRVSGFFSIRVQPIGDWDTIGTGENPEAGEAAGSMDKSPWKGPLLRWLRTPLVLLALAAMIYGWLAFQPTGYRAIERRHGADLAWMERMVAVAVCSLADFDLHILQGFQVDNY